MDIKLSRYNQTSQLNVLQEGLKRYVIRPANRFGLGGFVFGIEGETSVRSESDITDHYVEDNSVVQDHFATRPVQVTLRGYVGELTEEPEVNALSTVQKVVRKLTVLDAYLPQLTQAAQVLKNGFEDINTLEQVQDEALNLWELTQNLNPAASEQQKAFLYFEALQQQKLLVSLQTPFRFYQNMAIMSISARQPEDSNEVSDFSITLKQIRVAENISVAFDEKSYQGRTDLQQQGQDERGKAQGKETTSGLVDIFGGLF